MVAVEIDPADGGDRRRGSGRRRVAVEFEVAQAPWAGGGALALLLAGTFAVRTAGTREAGFSPPMPVPLTSYPQSEGYPSFAPDGKRFAFSWDRVPGNHDIFVRAVEGGEARRLTTHPQPDYNAAWSPDGRHIAFLRALTSDAAELLLVPSEGGLERSLGQFQGVARSNLKVPPPQVAWTPDNNYLIMSAYEGMDGPLRLFRVAVSDGARVPVLKTEVGILGDAGRRSLLTASGWRFTASWPWGAGRFM